MEFQDIVEKINLKKLIIIPIVMLIFSMLIVANGIIKDSLPMGFDLKGGTLITIYNAPANLNLKEEIRKELGYEVKVGSIKSSLGEVGKTLEINQFLSTEEKEKITDFLVSLGIKRDNIMIRDAEPSISKKLLRDGVKAVIFAFIFMAIVVFLRFKTFVPSFAVVLSAFSDIVTTIAMMCILGIELTAGSLVALLLLIGYSVDTDILLTTRLLVRKGGTFNERLASAMKTGLTMASTTICAVFMLFIASSSIELKQIAVVILIGLVIDIINTWIQNAAILEWYVEKMGKGKRLIGRRKRRK